MQLKTKKWKKYMQERENGTVVADRAPGRTARVDEPKNWWWPSRPHTECATAGVHLARACVKFHRLRLGVTVAAAVNSGLVGVPGGVLTVVLGDLPTAGVGAVNEAQPVLLLRVARKRTVHRRQLYHPEIIDALTHPPTRRTLSGRYLQNVSHERRHQRHVTKRALDDLALARGGRLDDLASCTQVQQQCFRSAQD